MQNLSGRRDFSFSIALFVWWFMASSHAGANPTAVLAPGQTRNLRDITRTLPAATGFNGAVLTEPKTTAALVAVGQMQASQNGALGDCPDSEDDDVEPRIHLLDTHLTEADLAMACVTLGSMDYATNLRAAVGLVGRPAQNRVAKEAKSVSTFPALLRSYNAAISSDPEGERRATWAKSNVIVGGNHYPNIDWSNLHTVARKLGTFLERKLNVSGRGVRVPQPLLLLEISKLRLTSLVATNEHLNPDDILKEAYSAAGQVSINGVPALDAAGRKDLLNHLTKTWPVENSSFNEVIRKARKILRIEAGSVDAAAPLPGCEVEDKSQKKASKTKGRRLNIGSFGPSPDSRYFVGGGPHQVVGLVANANPLTDGGPYGSGNSAVMGRGSRPASSVLAGTSVQVAGSKTSSQAPVRTTTIARSEEMSGTTPVGTSNIVGGKENAKRIEEVGISLAVGPTTIDGKPGLYEIQIGSTTGQETSSSDFLQPGKRTGVSATGTAQTPSLFPGTSVTVGVARDSATKPPASATGAAADRVRNEVQGALGHTVDETQRRLAVRVGQTTEYEGPSQINQRNDIRLEGEQKNPFMRFFGWLFSGEEENTSTRVKKDLGEGGIEASYKPSDVKYSGKASVAQAIEDTGKQTQYASGEVAVETDDNRFYITGKGEENSDGGERQARVEFGGSQKIRGPDGRWERPVVVGAAVAAIAGTETSGYETRVYAQQGSGSLEFLNNQHNGPGWDAADQSAYGFFARFTMRLCGFLHFCDDDEP